MEINKAQLFISLPGSTDHKFFEESVKGGLLFKFAGFDASTSLEIPLKQSGDEDFSSSFADDPGGYFPAKVEYEQLISKTIDHIRENKLGKIVISRSEKMDLKIDPVSVFKKLAQAYPAACVYLFSHPQAGCWMGATPELLLEKKGDFLKTMSLAGTKEKGKEESFSAKEEVEQQMVTDYIFDLFERERGLSNAQKKGPFLAEAGKLFHFKTEISAEADQNFTAESFMEKLHPTPAIAGFPKEAALDFIRKNENYNRQFYAGYFGLSRGDEFQYFVNLRCMQVFEDQVWLYAGGGITVDSDPEAEWLETAAKMRTLLDVIEQ